MWLRDDLLNQYRTFLKWDELSQIRHQRFEMIRRDHWQVTRQSIEGLPTIDAKDLSCSFTLPAVSISTTSALAPEVLEQVKQIAELLIPWRKGPFELFGYFIDSEWQSNLKWDRILSALPNLKSRKVADVGCGNGYYMFRMLPFSPECVVGFDPSEKFYFAFEFIQHFVRAANLQFELLGIENFSLFPNFFEVVFCMGVLYHQRNPLEALSQLREGLTPGGSLVLETLTIEGNGLYSFFPEDRYAKMRNVYFLPTQTTLINWLKRSGFVGIEVISESVTTAVEQRRTRFSTGESLEDFLDPADSSKTVEGYPAPRRTVVIAKRSREGR